MPGGQNQRSGLGSPVPTAMPAAGLHSPHQPEQSPRPSASCRGWCKGPCHCPCPVPALLPVPLLGARRWHPSAPDTGAAAQEPCWRPVPVARYRYRCPVLLPVPGADARTAARWRCPGAVAVAGAVRCGAVPWRGRCSRAGPGRAAEGRGSLPVAAAGETRCDLPLENRCWAALPPGEGPPPEPVCDRLRRGRGTSISAGRGSASRRAAQFSPQATGGGDAVSDVPRSMPSRSQQGVGL